MAADGRLTFDTKLNAEGFEEGKEKIEEEAKELSKELENGAETTVDVKADTSQAQQSLDDLQAEINDVADEPAKVSIDTEPAADSVEEINDDLDGVRKTAEKTSDSVSSNVRAAAKSAENKVDSSAAHIEESLRRVQKGFKTLLAAAGVTFSLGAATKFGKEAVEAAAEINAQNSQLSQTFGVLENNATEAMERVAEASGIIRTRLQGVGTSVYAFARTSGMDTAQALGMMEEALQVAADSAAYYDRSLEDTSETLLSFLKGNYANDAALGLSATETTRNAAANKLYGKSFQELSEAQKQLTLLQMVKDANALSGAEGQAAREAEGWENVIGNLKEAWRQLLAVVGQPVLKLAVTWVQQLTQALTTLTEKAQIAMNTLAALFGKEVESTGETAENIGQSVSAQQDLTDAVEDTVKAESKSLAGFDKINTVASDKSTSAGGSGSGGAAAAVTPTISVKDNIPETSERLVKFVTGAKKRLGSLLKYAQKNFGPSFKKVWRQLSPELERFGTNCEMVFTDIRSLGPPLISYLQGDFTSALNTFVLTAGGIFAGLLNSANTVFYDLWNVAAFPCLSSFVTYGLPMITQFCEQFALTFGAWFDEVKQTFDMLWKDAAVPALSLVSSIWTDTMEILSKVWNEHGEVIFKKFRTAIRTTGNLFRTVWRSFLKPVFDTLMRVLDEIWNDHAKPLLENFLSFAAELAEVALDIYNNFIAPIVNWFVEKLGPVLARVLSGMLETVGEKIGNIMDIFNDLFTLLKELLHFVTAVFSGNWREAWISMKNVLKAVWNLFVDIVKIPLNTAIGLINTFISGVEKAINFLIDCLNKISIDIPSWVPEVGGKSFGIDFNHISIGKIPKLAQGTVIPANFGNFLAMLGDNKREPEVVSPLSTMEQALENVLARNGNSSDRPIIVQCILDGREIGRVAVKAVADDNRRKGA